MKETLEPSVTKSEMVLKAIDLLNASFANHGEKMELIVLCTSADQEGFVEGIQSCSSAFERSVVKDLMMSGMKRSLKTAMEQLDKPCDCENCRKHAGESTANDLADDDRVEPANANVVAGVDMGKEESNEATH